MKILTRIILYVTISEPIENFFGKLLKLRKNRTEVFTIFEKESFLSRVPKDGESILFRLERTDGTNYNISVKCIYVQHIADETPLASFYMTAVDIDGENAKVVAGRIRLNFLNSGWTEVDS